MKVHHRHRRRATFNAKQTKVQKDFIRCKPDVTHINLQSTINIIAPITSCISMPMRRLAPLGAIFPTVPLGKLPPVVVTRQSLVPQLYPLGQHPPLRLGAQEYHPLAHLLVSPAPAVAVVTVPVPLPPLVLDDVSPAESFDSPAPAIVAASPTGTTTVIPLLVRNVVDAVAGQDVLSQLRPTRQHPPR